jgi:hypothetical protein
MTHGDEYRKKAANLTALSEVEGNPSLRLELALLSMSYTRLAEQADRNDETDLVYVTPEPDGL